jgi:hypothetical protein
VLLVLRVVAVSAHGGKTSSQPQRHFTSVADDNDVVRTNGGGADEKNGDKRQAP